MRDLRQVRGSDARPRRFQDAAAKIPGKGCAVGGQTRDLVERGVRSGRLQAARFRLLRESVERQVHRHRPQRLGGSLSKVERGARGDSGGEGGRGHEDSAPGHGDLLPAPETATGIAVRRGPRPSSGIVSAAMK
jgi:hypothetical protein